MAFEIRERDLLARIGRLRTKSGTIETPLLFPVINPSVQLVPPRKVHELFGFEAVITNAYILKKRFKNHPAEKGVHKFLDFNGTIMTDSGAYQILVYGDIETTSQEIVEYQEQIDTDIATILDWPTGWKVSRKHAEKTVNETLKRAKELFKIKTRKDILWVGPIQGGQYLDLIAKSALEIGRLPFQIYALGSPTEVMENYRFDVLVDMIMAAKMNSPIQKPFHLFGAGHPFMFSLAVALGCDLFDSAAYAIYSRENRYMTEYGTSRLSELEYFPCSCPRCSKTDPKEVLKMPTAERENLLAEHNLYACQSELRRVKQAIKEGRLWEHVEMRAHGHPTLLQALNRLKTHQDFIEKHSPTVKKRGIFFFDSIGLIRPEVVRHQKRLTERYSPPKEAEILLLVPQTKVKPLHKSKEFKEAARLLHDAFDDRLNTVHTCFYAAPFGVIPIELDEVYPLSQHEIALPPDEETIKYVAEQVAEYINHTNYATVVLVYGQEDWHKKILNKCKKACLKRAIKFECCHIEENWSKTALIDLKKVLHRTLSEQP